MDEAMNDLPKIENYWTWIALALIPISFLTVGGAVPFLILFGYLSVKKDQAISLLRQSIGDLDNYEKIHDMIESGDIDKDRLATYVKLAKWGDAFEQQAYELGVSPEYIEAIIEEKVKPYKESFYKAGLILEVN